MQTVTFDTRTIQVACYNELSALKLDHTESSTMKLNHINLNHTGGSAVSIRSVRAGEYIKRKTDSKSVYIKGDYIRSNKSFECIDTQDISRSIYIKASKSVIIGFTY